MLIVLTGPNAVAPNGTPRQDVVNALKHIKLQANAVAIVSNHEKPLWFDEAFSGSSVQFIQSKGRQNGKIVSENALRLKVSAHDTLVLAATDADIQMGKNGGAVLLAAGWATDRRIRDLGVRVDSGDEFMKVVQLTASWGGNWWFKSNMPNSQYSIRALADLSSMYGKTASQQNFALKLRETVKNGGPALTALLVVTARSLLSEGVASQPQLFWGVYPSSKSTNNDKDILSDFCHRLRTITSRVRYAERNQPLFIRHKPSKKRSAGETMNRMDPTEQIETIHINPHYRNKITGRHVLVIDDCTTYGLSFGVANALLRRAGAVSVTGIALGKFGNCTRHFVINISTDPFSPISRGGFIHEPTLPFQGITSDSARSSLSEIIP